MAETYETLLSLREAAADGAQERLSNARARLVRARADLDHVTERLQRQVTERHLDQRSVARQGGARALGELQIASLRADAQREAEESVSAQVEAAQEEFAQSERDVASAEDGLALALAEVKAIRGRLDEKVSQKKKRRDRAESEAQDLLNVAYALKRRKKG